jgi:protein-S-isoprenylcysteine O-methyltransferase Ste14
MTPSRDNAGVIVPPPLIYLTFLAVGLALDFLVLRIATGVAAPVRCGLAGVIAAAALALGGSALLRFRRAGTSPEPWRPATVIVANGVYRFTRNPMYLGMTVLYLALAIAADSVVALVLVVPAVAIIRYGVIAREERYLEAKFGDDYRRYKATVRRWL